jgi:hypothetical protein
LAYAEDSERRFRSNMALEGLDAWEELNWVGRQVRIGTVTLDVVRPKVRCLATHANPTTGERDVPMRTTLTTVFRQEKPTFGVAMVPRSGGRAHARRRSRDTRGLTQGAQLPAMGMRPLQAYCHRGLGLLYTATGQQE